MPNTIPPNFRERFVFPGETPDAPKLYVADLVRKRGKAAQHAALVVAGQIAPHLQQDGGRRSVELFSPFTRLVAEHILTSGSYSVAYERANAVVSDSRAAAVPMILAFAVRERINSLGERVSGRPEYALSQFGVTTRTDLRDRHLNEAPDDMAADAARLRACGALMLRLVQDVPAEARFNVLGYREDTRKGYFFESAGLRMVDIDLRLKGGDVYEGLAADIQAALLGNPAYALNQGIYANGRSFAPVIES